MEKLKCDNCGGKLIVDEKGEYAYCEYCDYKYKLKKDVDLNIKLDDSVKSVFKPVAHAGAITMIVSVIIAVIVFGMIIFFAVNMFTDSKKPDEFDIRRFNSSYEMSAGTNTGFMLSGVLDDVVTNNKKDEEHIIKVTYNGKTTKKESEIIAIKDSLSTFNNYEVSYNYGKDKFINEVVITEK